MKTPKARRNVPELNRTGNTFDVAKLRSDLGFKNPNAVKGYYLNKYKAAVSSTGYRYAVQVHIPYMRDIDPKASNVIYVGAFDTEEEANKVGRKAAELVRKNPERYKNIRKTDDQSS